MSSNIITSEGNPLHLTVASSCHASLFKVIEWQKIFLTYVVIYVDAHPLEAAALTTFCSTQINQDGDNSQEDN